LWAGYENSICRLRAEWSRSKEGTRNPLNRFGAKYFSQGEEDGLTLEIIKRLGIKNGTFAELGVGNGLENNTLILLASGSGLCLDASAAAEHEAQKAHPAPTPAAPALMDEEKKNEKK
jgi:hypothetical protein